MIFSKKSLKLSFHAAILWAFCLSFFEMLQLTTSASANWIDPIDVISVIAGLFAAYAIIWFCFLLPIALIFNKYFKERYESEQNMVLFLWVVAFFSYELLWILVRMNSGKMYNSLYGILSVIISTIFAVLIAYALFQLMEKLIQKGKLNLIGLKVTAVGISLTAYAMICIFFKYMTTEGEINPIFAAVLMVFFLVISKYIFIILKKMSTLFIGSSSKVISQKSSVLSIFIPITIVAILAIPGSAKNAKISSKPNVILISLDTVRADHLSCYNEMEKKNSPNIDKIAKDGYLFKKAYSTTSWTLPAHASIMTGLFPSSHRADRSLHQTSRNPVDPLPRSHTTLAEVLRDHGYVTAGVISVPYLTSRFGMDRGFQFYHEKLDLFENFPFIYQNDYSILTKLLRFLEIIDNNDSDSQKRVTEVNEEALNWIEKNKDSRDPFFLFLHYFDPHYIYDPPEPYNIHEDGTKLDYFLEMERLNKGQFSLSSSGIKDLITLYDGEIRYLDHHLGKLFEKLNQWKLLDNTLLIITSDHGESFNEHEVWTHGNRLYQEQIHVPMIVRYPKLVPSAHIDSDHIVQLVDLMPTILDILQIPISKNVQGRSLLPIFQGKPDLEFNLAFAELRPDINWKAKNSRFGDGIKAVIQNKWKYILPDTGVEELYNINLDPDEVKNLASSEKKMAEEMKSILLAWEKSVNQDKDNESGIIDSGALKQLRSLGYVK